MIHHHHAPAAPPRAARGARAGDARACGRRRPSPPREGNALEVLIDGANALPRDGRGDPRRAAPRPRLLVAPRARLRPAARARRRPVRDLLAETAERVPVRVLVWAGAPVPVFKPRRGVVKAERDELVRGTKIQCRARRPRPDDALPPREARDRRRRGRLRRRHRPDRAGRRPLRLQRRTRTSTTAIGWHDASSLLRGPIVARRRRPLRAALGGGRGRGARAAGAARAGRRRSTAQFIRTVPEGAYEVLPRGEFSILETYVRALRGAQQLIYLENQFLWSPEIVDDPRGQARAPAERRLPRRRPAPAQGQQRPGRHARHARPARRGRQAAAARLLAATIHVAHRRALRPALRAREDRHRRRRLARDRLREPQRALAVQRHRGRRRHLRPGPRPRHAPAAVGRAPRARGRRSRATRRRCSTSCGSRSRPSSSSAAARERR